jgi:peptide deformylase
MMNIETYGSQALREKATEVTEVDASIRDLADEMLKTMYANRGLGLAAEQVGRTESMCVIDVPREHLEDDVTMPLVLINPRIESMDGEVTAQEGCLSFPEIYVNIRRAMTVEVSYHDLDMQRRTLTVTGLLARAVQHEIDHLNGVLLVDRMSPVQRVSMAGKLKRLKRRSA